jgi:hypothetical protein
MLFLPLAVQRKGIWNVYLDNNYLLGALMKKTIYMVGLLLSFCMTQIAGAAEPAKKLQPASQAAIEAAQKSLEKIVIAYTNSDLATVEAGFDAKMTGYQKLIDGIRQDFAKHKNVRVSLSDTNFAADANSMMVSSNWEKHFITTASTAGSATGRITILMSRSKDGWKISGIKGDNFFVKP